MATSIRQKKVAAQIQRIVAIVLQREVADPRVDGLVSVTKVEVSPDLREAKVFLSVLGGKRTPATVIEGIKSAGRHIQNEVADNLAMRFAPRLTYLLDETLKKQAEILKKIREAVGDGSTNAAGSQGSEEKAGESEA
jgi:ribosome-binding factor A